MSCVTMITVFSHLEAHFLVHLSIKARLAVGLVIIYTLFLIVLCTVIHCADSNGKGLDLRIVS